MGSHCEPFALLKGKLREAISIIHRKLEIASSLTLLAMTIPQITNNRAPQTKNS